MRFPNVVRRGRLWEYIRAPQKSGTKESRWVATDIGTSRDPIAVYPPNEMNRCWAVEVDDIDLINLTGRDAETLAFDVAEAFAQAEDPIRKVLSDQGFQKRARPSRQRKYRHK